MADVSNGQQSNVSSGLKAEDLEDRLQKKEIYIVDHLSGFPTVFNDCIDLIAKARSSIKGNDLIQANSMLLKLEARIKAAEKSREMLIKNWFWLSISVYNIGFLLIAIAVGWWAMLLLSPLRAPASDNTTQVAATASDNATPVAATASDNATQAAAASTDNVSTKKTAEKVIPLPIVYWLVLGFSAGMLGGVVIGLFGLVYHGVQGDFSKDYLPWYWLKPLKGGLAGAVAVLPFLAGLAVFQIDNATQVQTAVAYIAIASFLVGYCERNFLQLMDRIGTIIFKPSDSAGTGNSQAAKPS